MTIGETLDWISSALLARWHEFTLVFSKTINDWPLWAGALVFGLMVLGWRQIIREELQHLRFLTPKMLEYRHAKKGMNRLFEPLFGGVKGILTGVAVYAVAAWSSFYFEHIPDIVGVACVVVTRKQAMARTMSASTVPVLASEGIFVVRIT